MLLVLDDVWKASDVLTLLQAQGQRCRCLITTRLSSVAEQVATTVWHISPWNSDGSLAYLSQLAPLVVEREPEQIRDLVRSVGGLPLALELLGRHLRKISYGPAHNARAVWERINDKEERFRVTGVELRAGAHPSLPDGVELSLLSLLSAQEAHLTPHASQALSALSICPAFPESFTSDEALAVADCDAPVLAELLDAGLLEADGDLYQIHPVVADYARFSLTQEAEEAARERLLAYRARQQEVEAVPPPDPVKETNPFRSREVGLLAHVERLLPQEWLERPFADPIHPSRQNAKARYASAWRIVRLGVTVGGVVSSEDQKSGCPP
jgi:hypothetical protein